MPTWGPAWADALMGALAPLKADGAIQRALTLLQQQPPDELAARLDSQAELLKRHLDALRAALEALPGTAKDAFSTPPASPHRPPTGDDQALDAIALSLLSQPGDGVPERRALAVAVGRLVEDSQVLLPTARYKLPLGRGFEGLFDERLRHRYQLIPDHLDLLALAHRHRLLLYEEPDEARRVLERELGRALEPAEREWLELERKAGMLRFVRHDKTEGGHIRWYVRADRQHGVVLERLGLHGHWIACGGGEPGVLAQMAVAVERVIQPSAMPMGMGWRAVLAGAPGPHGPAAEPGPASSPLQGLTIESAYLLPVEAPGETDLTVLRQRARWLLKPLPVAQPDDQEAALRAIARALSRREVSAQPGHEVSRTPRFVLSDDPHGLALLCLEEGRQTHAIARLAYQATEDQVLSFLDALNRIAELSVPADGISPERAEEPSVLWSRALLANRGAGAPGGGDTASKMRVRLIYVPSSIPHQLGGVPQVGIQFLADRLRRQGASISVLALPAEEFDRRLVELLGADVIGIGIYIHNREEVARLITALRQAGYRGFVVLGGPEARSIEAVQSSIQGWDAIIRGEAEEALPKVIEILTLFERGHWAEGFKQARSLQGVVLRCGESVLLCETSARNRVQSFTCPLPYHWSRDKVKRRLKMNFTRGCPYLCVFCPNHQGRRFRAGEVDELWRYTVLATADELPLPQAVERQVVQVIQARLGLERPPPLRVALDLFWRVRLRRADLEELLGALRGAIDPTLWADGAALARWIGLEQAIGPHLAALGEGEITSWQGREAWLLAKAAVLASRQLWRETGTHRELLQEIAQRAQPRFILETSEDNTLVNRHVIMEYLARRRRYGLSGDLIFNPGQNTIWDLTDKQHRGRADEEYIAALVEENPFAVALGADGPSNAVIRQNRKPFYGVQELVAVNRALSSRGVTVANNYILLTPETNLLEAIESFVLFLVLPVTWRDYGQAINLRVIKEETTLSNDEGLIFAPDDSGNDVPLRDARVQELIERWGLASPVPSAEIRPLLWRMLEEDPQAASLLPWVIERWERNFDNDEELVSLARMVRQHARPGEALVSALQRAAEAWRAALSPS